MRWTDRSGFTSLRGTKRRKRSFGGSKASLQNSPRLRLGRFVKHGYTGRVARLRWPTEVVDLRSSMTKADCGVGDELWIPANTLPLALCVDLGDIRRQGQPPLLFVDIQRTASARGRDQHMPQLGHGPDVRAEQARKADRWVIAWVAFASIAVPIFVLPAFQAFLLYAPPIGRPANPDAPFNIYLNCLLNSVVMIWAMRVKGRLDRKIAAVFSRVIIVHGTAAFIILVAREYYSNQVMLVSAGLSFILGLAVVLVLDRGLPKRVAVIGGERCALGLKIPCDVITDPDADLRVYDVILTDTLTDLSSEWSAALSRAMLAGRQVRHLAEYVEEDRGIVSLEHFDLEHIPHAGLTSYRTRKRLLDIFLVILSLPVTVPLVLLSAIVVRITMGGPTLFVQQRVGLGGEEFTIYKLRTMAIAASNELGRATLDGDLRVTPVGRFLRRYRIDELPQLWNVLKGDMSVIGPRPEWTVLSESYAGELPVYRYRSLVRPGITGWAQVCGGYASHIDEVKNKVGYDLYYIKNFSFALDVHIIIRTVWTLWTGFGAR